MTEGRRTAGWGLVVAVLVAYVAAGVLGALLARVATGPTDDPYADVGVLLGHVALPPLLGLVVGAAATSLLRWWDVVLHDRRPVRPWAWIFPAGMVVGGAAFADWTRLAGAGLALLAALLIAVLLIAASEELMFRGVVLQAMRDRYGEGIAALLSTALFAVMHVVVGGGLGNLAQGFSTLVGGFLYYLARRVSGGLLVPVLVHALWDFFAFSALLGPGSETDPSAFEALLVLVALALIGLVAWRPLNRVHAVPDPSA